MEVVGVVSNMIDGINEEKTGASNAEESFESIEDNTRANKANADLFISVHNNSDATGNFTKVKGTQVMYSESDDAKLSSKKLAEICLKNVVDTTGSENRGLLKGDSIYIIRTSEVPVALIEVGFMTNYKELDLLNSTSYQKKAAEGIYNAINEAFQEGY